MCSEKKHVRTKDKFILVFLALVIIRIAPDWIERQGYRNGMAWTWLIIFLICIFTGFVKAWKQNQQIKWIKRWQRMNKKGMQERFKNNAGLNVKDKFP